MSFRLVEGRFCLSTFHLIAEGILQSLQAAFVSGYNGDESSSFYLAAT
jgi:hypothetical protein